MSSDAHAAGKPSNPWYVRIQNVDKRIIYALMFPIFLLPLIRPLGIPLNISPGTRRVFEIIDSLPPGSMVFHSVGIQASADAEVWPQMVALSQHYMKKGLRVVYLPVVLEGGMYVERIVKNIVPKYGYRYGTDFAVLPFKAGGEPAIAGLRDFFSFYTVDAYGNNLRDLPIFQGFRGMEDVDVLVVNTVGNEIEYYVRHIEPAYDLTIVAAGAATVLPVISPYLGSGQVKGIVSGLSGAAEYEVLAEIPGQATGAMDAQAMGHMLILALIFLGNLGFRVERRKSRAAEVRSNG